VPNTMNDRMRWKLAKIKMVAMDVDGVLTDGGMYYTDKGDVMKKFNARDGKAMEMLQREGFILAFITGEKSLAVEARAKKLRIKDVCLGCKDKVRIAEALACMHRLKLENMLYVGDDWGDIGLLKRVGVSCAPLDAIGAVSDCVDCVCQRKGGEGVMAEVARLLLEGKSIDCRRT
jgi:3-deoxy-D-manno-octulosonate 8-phosphate phosphatase (KDO 8-P phosphatase)